MELLEFFIYDLSICEFGNSLISLFFMLSNVFSCLSTLVVFLQGLGITGRALFQCLICVERYQAVVHPVTFLKYKPLRYRVICCTVAWIIILGSCLCCMLLYSLLLFFILTPLNMKAYCWFFLTQFLLFPSVQLFFLVTVLRALKQSGPGERKKGDKKHTKRRAFNIILISTVNVALYHSILYHSDTAVYMRRLVWCFDFLCTGWFCSACSLSAPEWKTFLPLFSIKPGNN